MMMLMTIKNAIAKKVKTPIALQPKLAFQMKLRKDLYRLIFITSQQYLKKRAPLKRSNTQRGRTGITLHISQ
jgi:hypothetical protein